VPGRAEAVRDQHRPPFYTKIYDAAPGGRAALEVLFLVLAEWELAVKEDAEISTAPSGSAGRRPLRHALDWLVPEETMVNKAAAVAERRHMSAEAERAAQQDIVRSAARRSFVAPARGARSNSAARRVHLRALIM
jgi:hypothetical protein